MSKEGDNYRGEEDGGPPSLATIVERRKRRRILFPITVTKEADNEVKRILLLTKEGEEEHFSSPDVIKEVDCEE
jgi:hypothetical protein